MCIWWGFHQRKGLKPGENSKRKRVVKVIEFDINAKDYIKLMGTTGTIVDKIMKKKFGRD